MIPMRQLRSSPHFAHLFRQVHPLCWPILWWSLNRLFKWYATSGYEEILFATTRWGYVYVAYLGDRTPDPSAYRPCEPGKPRWDNSCWSTSVPAPLLSLAALEALQPGASAFLPRKAGGGESRQGRETQGACALASLDTS